MIKSGPSKFALVWAATTPLLLLAGSLDVGWRSVGVVMAYEVVIFLSAWFWLRK